MSMTVIEHIEVGSGGAGSIEFTSIPQTYTDLYILLSSRTEETGGETRTVLKMSLNSNITMSSRYLLGYNGSSVLSATSTNTGYIGVSQTDQSTANTYASASIYIPNYTSSNAKSVSVDSIFEANAADARQWMSANLYTAVTTAITSVKLEDNTAADWKQYTSATLYGITSGSDGTTTVS